jgi:formylmethanofuran dehydrogenase subunit E
MKCDLCNDRIINGIAYKTLDDNIICGECYNHSEEIIIKDGLVQENGEFLGFCK